MLFLVGCADHPRAPIEDRTGARTRTVAPALPKASSASPSYGSSLSPGKPYTVEKGDTLYAIAFRLGMDYRQLARLNNIPAPYTIFIGQRLKTASTSVAKSASSSSGQTSKRAASRPQSSPKTVAKATPTPEKAAPTPKKAAPATKSAPKPSAPTRTASKRTPSSSSVSSVLGPVTSWLWPTQGSVTRRYSTNLHKGVDISGNRGEPVRAAAPGVVVYAGTGVKGYGALLIVKHNEQYLSAYGHNDAILVREGERVSAGQQIARMGSTGTDTVKLHFEIRRQGKPVDPINMLPKR